MVVDDIASEDSIDFELALWALLVRWLKEVGFFCEICD